MKLDPKGKKRDDRKRAIKNAMRSRNYDTSRTPDGEQLDRWSCQRRAKSVVKNKKKSARNLINRQLHSEALGDDTGVSELSDNKHLVAYGTWYGDARCVPHLAFGGRPLDPNLTFEELLAEAEARRGHFDAIRSRANLRVTSW